MDIARKTALNAINDVFKENSFSNITLNNYFKKYELSHLDKSFATTLFYGVIDRRISLDYVISKYVKDYKKASDYSLNAIRLALYQIMFCDKIPQSAAVNESVNLVKESKEKYNASFVNGVLRNILRNGYALPDGTDIKSLSIKYSCPKHIIRDFINDYGLENAVNILKESLNSPPVFFRVNTLKTNKENLIKELNKNGLECFETELNNCLRVFGGVSFENLNAFKDGLFHIIDMSCQSAIKHLGVKSGAKVLDMCSAPGGKTFTMAEIMQNKGKIIACDIYEKRLNLVNYGAKRLGIDIIDTVLLDASKNNKAEKFDYILCDVPCSGYGVLRRKPEIKYKKQTDYSELTKTQKAILNNADSLLNSGGRIMYSTCTLRKAENQEVVKCFLESHSDYKIIFEHTYLPKAQFGDGFYCAVMEKAGD